MSELNKKLTFNCGAVMKNRFMLSPLTNTQSHEDGRLSDEEFHWLSMRAKGQFGMVMTCAANVQANGQGFPGQLGSFDKIHDAGNKKLAKEIQSHGSLAIIQLFHGGMRADQKLTGETPISASDVPRKSTRGMTLDEIHQLRENFILAAKRAQDCGYDGVEIHGAHGYIIAQFISASINQRTDEYGGNLDNRSRLLFEIVAGIRDQCGPNFLIGVRLSPERFGMQLAEIKAICKQLIDLDQIDFLDLSLWDCFKLPEEETHQEKTLLEHFTAMDKKNVKLTVAGNIRSAQDVVKIISAGIDFVAIGRAGILHHDFPILVQEDPEFEHIALPVTADYLKKEGLSDRFVDYMRNWKGFVKT